MTPEFHRPEPVDTIGDVARSVSVVADAAERAALATRFALAAINSLEGQFSISSDAGGIVARGRVIADVVQACVITGDPVTAKIDEPVALRFVNGDDPVAEEIELTIDALDTIPFDGAAIDLGEASAETMALALDPFPRSANADVTLRNAGVLQEGDLHPENALSGLKALLENKKA